MAINKPKQQTKNIYKLIKNTENLGKLRGSQINKQIFEKIGIKNDGIYVLPIN